MLVLSALQHVRLEFFLFDHESLLELLHFQSVASFAFIDAILTCLELCCDFVVAPENRLLNLFFEPFIFILKETLNSGILRESVLLPPLAFILELCLQALVLLMQLLLAAFTFTVDCGVTLVGKLLTELSHILFVLICHDFFLASEFRLVHFMGPSQVFLITLDDLLDLRL
jgi:hypothetical protein